VTIITYRPNKRWTSGITTTMTASESRKATKIVYICYGRRHYDSRLSPPEAPLSGDQLENPINLGDMDNTSFHLEGRDTFHGTQSIYIYTSKISIIKRNTLSVLMVIWNGLRLTNGSAGCAHLDV
jgi:hypothetical protein